MGFEDSEWKHVSPHAKKFVADLLVLDAKKRPSAFEALEHPWVVEHMPKMKQVALSSEAMGSMKGFRKQGKVQKAALNMVAKNVPTRWRSSPRCSSPWMPTATACCLWTS